MRAASEKLVYECEFCEEQLGPKANACPRCGQEFDEPVPLDAALPAGMLRLNHHGTSWAARETIVLGPRRRTVPRLPSLRHLTRRWRS